MKPIIETRQAEKLYQVGDSTIHAVDGINLQVEKGEFLCISGRSGSGKSTLLSLLAGLESPTAGEIEILGRHTSDLCSSPTTCFLSSAHGRMWPCPCRSGESH